MCQSGADRLILRPVAYMHSEFPAKFGLPRQSGMVEELQAEILFCEDFRNVDLLRGLTEFSHIWLLWGFSAIPPGQWSPTVRPPRLGGNARRGVFATRSPFRPNPIGLSCVRLEEVRLQGPTGPRLRVSGADLMDGTPIYDIKPYLPFTDSQPDACGGFADAARGHLLEVEIPPELLPAIPPARLEALRALLALDPRPAYQDDPARIYGMEFAGMTIRFTVSGQQLTVCEILKNGLDK